MWRRLFLWLRWCFMIATIASYSHGFVLRQRANRKGLGSQGLLFMSTTSSKGNIRSIAIVGGGLAGLSTAFHLLEQQKHRTIQRITIFDTHPVGMGGASAVAGGLLHPLTPRGKTAFLGWEGIEATNRLVDRAASRNAVNPQHVVLRDEIFRVATSQDYATKFQRAAEQHSTLGCFEWIPPSHKNNNVTVSSSKPDSDHPLGKYGSETIQNNKFGVLRMFGRCGRVIHVPSYLQALWDECRSMNTQCAWELIDQDTCLASSLEDSRFDDYDTVVYCAGAGLFRNKRSESNRNQVLMLGVANNNSKTGGWNVQLVRGQSMELKARQPLQRGERTVPLLFGKYICPTIPSTRVEESTPLQEDSGEIDKECLLVGATHEFSEDAWSPEVVAEDLWGRLTDVTPYINEGTHEVSAVTSGYRVQTQRSPHGRLPMLGRLEELDKNVAINSRTSWVFTGLSSRGLLYHGLFGKVLADAILLEDEQVIFDAYPELRWWKPISQAAKK